MDEARQAVLGGAVDREVGRRFARAGELRANAGVVGHQGPGDQIGPRYFSFASLLFVSGLLPEPSAAASQMLVTPSVVMA